MVRICYNVLTEYLSLAKKQNEFFHNYNRSELKRIRSHKVSQDCLVQSTAHILAPPPYLSDYLSDQ